MLTLDMQKEAAWNYIPQRLFFEKTNLVYDCFSSMEQKKRFAHLPWPDKISTDFPNPCGWGTGMEDCMPNAGSVIEICRLRYRIQQDPEAMRFACRIINGTFACTHVHGKPGLVGKMIHAECHEGLRLPTIYLAVYDVSEEKRYLDHSLSAGQSAEGHQVP